MVRNSTLRNVAVAVVVLVAVHLFYTVTYPRVVSYSAAKYWSQEEDSSFDPKKLAAHVPPTSETDDAAYAESVANATERPRAALVVLARNSDLEPMRASMREMEDRFNRRFRYDWVFLNDEPFTEHFKLYTSSLTKAKTKYGLIPKEHWSYPSWIDQEKATADRERMRDAKVIYGGSLSYRHMCRFNSGFFFRHELLAEYEYYWRVEPGVKFYCDVLEDPFVTLKKSGKMYGFTITLYEYVNTIPTLWETTKEFIRDHPEHIAEDNSLGFISQDHGKTYNLCHFWSNFEIASLDFWRSKAYMDYFEHLDRKGGFFYERWGDAPVHSIAAALLLKKNQIHFFNDIGYFHNPFHHCPPDPQTQLRCVCEVKNNFDDIPYSCLGKWKNVAGVP